MAKSTSGRAYRKTKMAGVFALHERGCAAELEDGPECSCEPGPRLKGKRRNAVTGKAEWQSPAVFSRSEVVTWLDADQNAGGKQAVREIVASEQRTFGALMDEFMAGAQAGIITRRRRGKPEPYARSTLKGYRRDAEYLKRPATRHQAGAELGDRPADDIDVHEWQELIDELRDAGLSYSRVANIKAVASAMYAWASHRARRKKTGIESNPLERVDLGANTGKRRERVAITEEAVELLAALDVKDQVPFGIAFYAGPRRESIHLLDWTDVTFVDGRPGYWLHIRPLADELGAGKTGNGREVPIAEPLRKILLEAHMRQGRPTSGRVCEVSVMSGKLGKRVRAAWKAANGRKAEQLGGELRPRGRREPWSAGEHELQRITLHECRHTYCSFLVAAKMDLAEIMEYMGHSQLSTTQLYIHNVTEHVPKETKAAALNALFADVSEAQSG